MVNVMLMVLGLNIINLNVNNGMPEWGINLLCGTLVIGLVVIGFAAFRRLADYIKWGF